MKAHGNGSPEMCASNLLRTVRGEVPFDRVRGRDGTLIDKPKATDDAVADAMWVLETFEPRVNIESIEEAPEEALGGAFSTLVNITRKEEEEE